MDNIVESLFGLTPFQVQQQQNAGLNQAADHYASQDPFQRATGGMFRAGGMLGGAGAQAMGMVNPQMEQAKLTEAMMASGGDLSTSQGLMAKSQQFAAAGDLRTALKLALAGKAMEKEEQAARLSTAREGELEARTKRELALAEAANQPKKIEAGKTRTYQKGQDSITEELQADGTWKQLGIGPKFSKSVINVGTGVDQGSDTFEPDVVDFYAKQALMTGDQTWRTGLGRSKDGVKLIIAVDKRIPKMASEVGMTAEEASNNKQMFGARLKAIKDFGTGQQGQMVNSFNTAIAHLDTLKDLGEALKNKDTQVINKVGNTVKEWFGNADVTNLDTAKQIVGAEIIKAIVARGGGVDERKEAANRISRISSPDQLVGYINTTQELLAGQLYSLENQYKTTTKQNDFGDKLLPRSKDALARLRKTSTSNVSQIPTENTTAVSVSNW